MRNRKWLRKIQIFVGCQVATLERVLTFWKFGDGERNFRMFVIVCLCSPFDLRHHKTFTKNKISKIYRSSGEGITFFNSEWNWRAMLFVGFMFSWNSVLDDSIHNLALGHVRTWKTLKSEKRVVSWPWYFYTTKIRLFQVRLKYKCSKTRPWYLEIRYRATYFPVLHSLCPVFVKFLGKIISILASS